MSRAGVLAFLVAVAIASTAIAADLKVPPIASPKPLSSSPVQVNQPSCSRWTDDCVNCMRGADGAAPVCSNIGFACQPNAIRCLAQ